MNARWTTRGLLLSLAIVLVLIALAGCGAGQAQTPLATPLPATPASPTAEVATPRPAGATVTTAPTEGALTLESSANQVALKTVKLRVSGFT